MLLSQLFENKHMIEADIASVNWNTDSQQDRLNEFAPGAGGDDEAGDDSYKYPKPERYRRSTDYFSQFEADHFDREDFDDATGEFKGHWGDKQIAYFKFDNPARTGSDDPGRGWYYEPQSGSSASNTSDSPAVDNADERKQQELSMIRAFLKSGNRPSPGSQIYSLMKRHGVAEGATDLASLKAKASKISDKIDAIVKDGGRVGLDDPLSKQLKSIQAKIQQAKKQGVAEATRKPRKPAAPQFTKYTNYELWERERYARGANYSETEIDGRLVGVAVVGTTYNEWGYVRDTGKVVGMWYNKASIGSFVQDGTSFDDSLSYAEQDTTWPYMNESQGVAEAPGAETLSHNQSTVSSNMKAFGLEEGDISQLEKDVADAPVEPIANMEAKEKVGNMDADAFDAAMARLKKLAGAGPLKTVYDPARRVYKNVPTAVQPKK